MRLQPVPMTLAATLLAATAPALAIPVLAIDLDPLTPGVQTTLAVTSGSSFKLDIVFSGDGAVLTEFDTAILAVYFNDSGSAVLGQTGGVAAGLLADRAPIAAADSFGNPSVSIASGDPLTSLNIAGPLNNFIDNSGLTGLQSTGGPAFSLNNTAETIQVMSLEFLALAIGETGLAINNITGGTDDPELAFTPAPTVTDPNPATVQVPVQLNGARVQVIAPTVVPEPAASLLLAGGLLLLGRRWR